MNFFDFNRKFLSWSLIILGLLLWTVIYKFLIVPNLPDISTESTTAFLNSELISIFGFIAYLGFSFAIVFFVKSRDDRWWQ